MTINGRAVKIKLKGAYFFIVFFLLLAPVIIFILRQCFQATIYLELPI